MAELTNDELGERLDIAIKTREELTKRYKGKIPKVLLERFISQEQRTDMIYFDDIQRLYTTVEKINKRLEKLEKRKNGKL